MEYIKSGKRGTWTCELEWIAIVLRDKRVMAPPHGDCRGVRSASVRGPREPFNEWAGYASVSGLDPEV